MKLLTPRVYLILALMASFALSACAENQSFELESKNSSDFSEVRECRAGQLIISYSNDDNSWHKVVSLDKPMTHWQGNKYRCISGIYRDYGTFYNENSRIISYRVGYDSIVQFRYAITSDTSKNRQESECGNFYASTTNLFTVDEINDCINK